MVWSIHRRGWRATLAKRLLPRGMALTCCIWFVSILNGPAGDAPSLSISFGERTAVFAGSVESEEIAEALVLAATMARPDLPIDRSGLAIDPGAKTPAARDLRSLVTELALSTHEGRFELWPDRIVVGGLTDSLVTQSALRIRAAAILDGRSYHNRLCIVDSDTLPRLEVSLADGSKAAPLPEAAVAAAEKETPFALPGLPLEKLLATRQLLWKIDPLAGKETAPHLAPDVASASPVSGLGEGAPSMDGIQADAKPQLISAIPVDTWTLLPSVFFSRNTFLPQANQAEVLDAVAKELLSPARLGAPIRVEAVKAAGGSGAFSEYLCERRAEEVLRFLSERGVEADRISMTTVESSSMVDSGEVRILVDLPPEMEEEVEVELEPASEPGDRQDSEL